MHVIAIANQKGGVGKTNVSANLIAEFAARGRKVVAIDLDPQATLSVWLLGVAGAAQAPAGVAQVLEAVAQGNPSPNLADVLVDCPAFGVKIAPAQRVPLSTVAVAMTGDASRLGDLSAAIADARIDADLVIIDTPPSIGALLTAAVFAATDVIVPVAVSAESYHGWAQFRSHVERLQRMKPNLRITGVVATCVERTRISKGILAKLQSENGDILFSATIRKAAVLGQLFAQHTSARAFAPDHPATADYHALATEILKRLPLRQEVKYAS